MLKLHTVSSRYFEVFTSSDMEFIRILEEQAVAAAHAVALHQILEEEELLLDQLLFQILELYLQRNVSSAQLHQTFFLNIYLYKKISYLKITCFS